MIQRFDAFVSGITSCYKYIQRIKSMEMTEFGLKGTHVMCLYYLRQTPADSPRPSFAASAPRTRLPSPAPYPSFAARATSPP